MEQAKESPQQDAPARVQTTPATGIDSIAEELTVGRAPAAAVTLPQEFGGRAGPEPTRYGDWEKNGRCIDF